MSGVYVKALDQRLRLGIGIGIERLVRVAIAAQEVLQPEHIAAVGIADDEGSAGPRLDQPHAAQDQGTHDPLAELGFRHQQRAQAFGCDDERFDRTLRDRVHKRRPARQLGQLPHECARPMGDDRLGLAGLGAPGDGDLAGQNDSQAETHLADFGQGIARRERPEHAESAQALDLRRLQSRKHLMASRVDDR